MLNHKEENGIYAMEKQPMTEAVDDISESDTDSTVDKPLLYRISDNPPIHLTIIFGFQQALLSFANQLALTLLVAEVVCGDHDAILRTKLLSSTMFMNGFTTLMMSLFGVRLPIFQGGSYEYIAPLAGLMEINPGQCKAGLIPIVTSLANGTNMLSDNMTMLNSTTEQVMSEDFIYSNLQGLMGSLMIAGAVHCLIGATGLIGVLLRFIGPVTIVPAILLVGLYMFKTVTRFVAVHWGIGLMTCAISLVLSLYLGRWNMPFPFWTRRKGWHIIRTQFHHSAAILIALIVGWIVCLLLTSAGAFSDDPNAVDYNARTDVHSSVIQNASWFYFPHPGQFGPPSFSSTALVGFLIATLISILDSIGDYYACARTCRVPPPPSHAVCRGISIEGFCSFVSGTVGCGHATSTYGGNIGAIGLTKVASRRVFMVVGILYMLFGILGKFSALFITIPHPVLGGTLITMTGMFTGVIMSNLQYVNLNSTRNLAVIGISLILGLMVPYWVEKSPERINTGIVALDQLLRILLGNPNLAGAVVACLLDNTIPGTREERGLTAWDYVKKGDDEASDKDIEKNDAEPMYVEGLEVYQPLLPKRCLRWRVLRYIPFLPDPVEDEADEARKYECNGNSRC